MEETKIKKKRIYPIIIVVLIFLGVLVSGIYFMMNQQNIQVIDTPFETIQSIQEPATIELDGIKARYTRDDLEVNCTLGVPDVEIAIPDSFIWRSGRKFGANFSFTALPIAKEDRVFQYTCVSNKEIKYDDGYYYFDEYKVASNDNSNIYTRDYLGVSGICDNKCTNWTVEYNEELGQNETVCLDVFEPVCSYGLEHTYQIKYNQELNITYYDLNYSTLKVNFTGFYDSIFDGVLIDPSYSITNVSTDASLTTQVRSEPTFSHLSTAINNSLFFYMPFDVNSTTVRDYTDNDNDGSLQGSLTWNSSGGHIGGTYEFDGVDDFIDISDNPSLDLITPFTFCSWFKRSDSIEREDIAGKWWDGSNRGWEITTVTSGGNLSINLAFRASGDGSDSVINNSNYFDFIATDWHFACVQYNSTAYRVSIDTISSTGWVTDDPFDTNNANMAIGEGVHTSINPYRPFNGTIDEVMIFNRSLTDIEIAQIYNHTFQKFYGQGNQTFQPNNITLGNNTAVNVTITGNVLNDSSLGVRVYETNLNTSTGYVSTGTDLLAYWHFDNDSTLGENDTLVIDSTGNGNDGVVIGGNITSTENKKYQRGMGFKPDGDYIQLSSPIVPARGGFTVSTWMYSTNLAPSQGIYTQYYDVVGNRFYLGAFASKITMQIGGVALTSTQTLSDNTWYHVIYMRNESNNTFIYVDGVLSNQSTETTLVDQQAGVIGAGLQGGTELYFRGYLDELIIWNRSLTVGEIESLYITGSTNHTNDGVGIDWTESSTGQQNASVINSTHLNATGFTITNTSTHLMADLEYGSTNGFYTPNVVSLLFETYYVAPALTCWTEIAGRIAIPPGCKYFTNVLEGIIGT